MKELQKVRGKLDWHSHECPKCMWLWRHDGSVERTSAQHAAAHKCPKCGTIQFQQYQQIWA